MKNYFCAIVLACLASVSLAQPSETSLLPQNDTFQIPANALSLRPITDIDAEKVWSAIVPSGPLAEGGPMYTFVELNFRMSSCNSLLPVQTGVAITPGKVTVLVAAVEILGAQVRGVHCHTVKGTHVVSFLGEVPKQEIELKVLGVTEPAKD